MNKAILIGNLVRETKKELKYTQGGMAILNNCIAINKKRKNANGQIEEKTTFIDLTFFGRTAEVVSQYCNKGDKIMVEGEIDIQDYQTQDGQNRRAFKVIVENMEMLGAKPQNNSGGYNQNNNYQNPQQSYNNPKQGYQDKYEENNGTIPF